MQNLVASDYMLVHDHSWAGLISPNSNPTLSTQTTLAGPSFFTLGFLPPSDLWQLVLTQNGGYRCVSASALWKCTNPGRRHDRLGAVTRRFGEPFYVDLRLCKCRGGHVSACPRKPLLPAATLK